MQSYPNGLGKQPYNKPINKQTILMENYSDVPAILGGQEPVVKIIGSVDLEPRVPAPMPAYISLHIW